MKLLLFFTFILSSFQTHASTDSCIDLFTKKASLKVFSPSGLKVFKSDVSQRELVYDYKVGSQKTVWLFIHGLGDEMSKMEGLAAKAEKDGFGILRIDLHGHGKTLSRFLRENENKLPTELDYQDNIEDLMGLVQSLKIKDLVIVGHSYGGGIAYGLSAALSQIYGRHKTHVRSVHMLAPYVQRVDKFLKAYFGSSKFLKDTTESSIPSSFKLTQAYFRTIMDPFLSFVFFFDSQLQSAREKTAYFLSAEKTQDFVMDPMMEQFLRLAYRRYFITEAEQSGLETSPDVLRKIDLKVKMALLVTKGIRSFDLLDSALELPAPHAPLQIIGGEKDTLVLPAQLKKLDKRLSQQKIPHDLQFLKGAPSHHLFPRTMPDEIYQMILDFLTTPKVFH